jgi:hypothetical protein
VAPIAVLEQIVALPGSNPTLKEFGGEFLLLSPPWRYDWAVAPRLSVAPNSFLGPFPARFFSGPNEAISVLDGHRLSALAAHLRRVNRHRWRVALPLQLQSSVAEFHAMSAAKIADRFGP